MKVELLKDLEAEKAKSIILSSDDIANSIFVLDCNSSLYQYIDNLKLGNVTLSKLKICKEIKNLNAQYDNGKEIKPVQTFSGLLEILDISKISYIIIKDDNQKDKKSKESVYTKVNNVLQQFIYLNIPLEKIRILTENERKNIKKTNQFEKTLTKHKQNVQKALKELETSKKLNSNNFKNIKQNVQYSLKNIENQLDNVNSNKMKITVVYKNNYEEFQNVKDVQKYLLDLFKSTTTDNENEYMFSEIEEELFEESKAQINNYKQMAQTILNDSDIVVFIIDYSMYLIDSEAKYFQIFKDICEQSNKFDSIIFDINKLDLQNKKDKNITYILDFIRKKLISLNLHFADSIIIGTSATTYFNCIENAKLKDYEYLNESTNLRDNLDDYIDKYKDYDEMTVISLISKMFQDVNDSQRAKLDNIERLKQSSGIPNLLNYIDYIVQNKTKIKQINNVMYNINQQYNYISSLFQFQGLETELDKNITLFDRTLEILDRFSSSVLSVFDEDADDVYQKYKQKQLKSYMMEKVACQRPLKFKIDNIFEEIYINKLLNSSSIIDEIIFGHIRIELSEKIEELLEKSNTTKKIDGEKRKIITENQILKCVIEAASGIENLVNLTVEDRVKALKNYLTLEQKNIQEDLENIINDRLITVNNIIEQCKRELNEQCSLPFNLKVPNFNFNFISEDTQNSKPIQIDFEYLEKNISDYLKDKMPCSKLFGIDGDSIMSVIGRILLSIRNQSKINRVCYDSNYIMKLYDDKEKGLSYIIKNALIGANIEQVYEEDKKNLLKYIKWFGQEVENTMESIKNDALEFAKSVKKEINHTNEYTDNIEYLKSKKVFLETINRCVKSFCNDWETAMNK